MAGLVIENQQLAETLRELAQREQRSVEALLLDLVERYQDQPSEKTVVVPSLAPDPVVRLHRFAYERARRYWHETGDDARAQLTDTELEAQHLRFDAQDVPYLKADVQHRESALARLAALARNTPLSLGSEAVSARSDAILDEEFADYLLKRSNRQGPDAAP